MMGPPNLLGGVGAGGGMMMESKTSEASRPAKATAGKTQEHIDSINEQLRTRKQVRIEVSSKEQAEDVLRAFISGRGFPRRYRNTTDQALPAGRKAESGSDWLPDGDSSYLRNGTYHWDSANPNAKPGDHAVEGNHLQIHNFDGRVIRIFYP
jgi:hypothetical protein